eukprot:scaffold86391_cov52-Attheya_sp.AAC.5
MERGTPSVAFHWVSFNRDNFHGACKEHYGSKLCPEGQKQCNATMWEIAGLDAGLRKKMMPTGKRPSSDLYKYPQCPYQASHPCNPNWTEK